MNIHLKTIALLTISLIQIKHSNQSLIASDKIVEIVLNLHYNVFHDKFK